MKSRKKAVKEEVNTGSKEVVFTKNNEKNGVGKLS